MSQNYETCYNTLSNIRAYGQECYNSFDYFIYFSLSSQHISLSVCNTALSLSLSLWSSSLCCFLFLSHFHFFISHSLPLSLHFGIIAANPTRLSTSFSLFFFPVTISLSFFSYHEEEGDSDLKQSSRWLKLANLNLCPLIKTTARPRAVADLCSSSSTVADLCSSSSTALAADILLFYFVEVFGFGICRRIWWLGL